MNETEYAKMYEVEDTHWWYVSLHNLILRFVPRDVRALRIFDAGCGTGRLLQLLSAYGRVQGCDASETALRYCRKRGLAAVVNDDLNTMALPQEEYDVITSIDVLYHAGIRDELAVMRKLQRALKPGGILIFQVPAYEWLRSNHDRAVHTRRRYQRTAVSALLRDAGFVIDKATYRVGFLLPPIALVRLSRRLFGKSGSTYGASDVKPAPKSINYLFGLIMRLENLMLKWTSFPAGTSVFVIARKPEPGYARNICIKEWE